MCLNTADDLSPSPRRGSPSMIRIRVAAALGGFTWALTHDLEFAIAITSLTLAVAGS